MESLYLLIPLSVSVVFVALWIFVRAMDSGQFDDLEGPAMRILQDDDRPHVRADAPGADAPGASAQAARTADRPDQAG